MTQITIAELAAQINAEFKGNGALVVSCAREPSDAQADDLAMAMDPKFAPDLSKGAAKAAVLWKDAEWEELGLEAAILVDRGRLAMSGITQIFDTGLDLPAGIHPTAIIDPTAQVGEGAAIGPFVVIGAGAVIGASVQIGSHVSIGADVRLGDDVLLHAGVRIAGKAQIGNRVIMQSNAVVGSDGFSYVTQEKSAAEQARESLGADVTADGQSWLRISSIGGVVIGDDVELGACVTIDQGTIRPTQVGDGSKLDNHVQIGHNVIVGRHCLLCGLVGIGGSTVIGDYCVLGGQVGVVDNIKIGTGAIIGAGSGVLSNVGKGKAMMGYPTVAMQTHVEMYKSLRRLPRFMRDYASKK